MANISIRRRSNGAPVTTLGMPNGYSVAGSEDRRETAEPDDSVDGSELDSTGAANDVGSSYDIVEPGSLSDSSGDAGSGTDTSRGSGKRRGRKPGVKYERKAKTAETSQALTGLLYSTHIMLATFLRADELALTEEEAEKVGKAVTNVAALYDLGEMGAKTVAWTNLAIALGTVYGPRVIAISRRKTHELQQTRQRI